MSRKDPLNINIRLTKDLPDEELRELYESDHDCTGFDPDNVCDVCWAYFNRFQTCCSEPEDLYGDDWKFEQENQTGEEVGG